MSIVVKVSEKKKKIAVIKMFAAVLLQVGDK